MSEAVEHGSDAEYTSLRSEILQWLQIRITILGFSLAVVGAVAISDSAKSIPWIGSELMLAVVLASAWLTWYATQGVLLIASYIIVFHEEPGERFRWETRLRAVKLPGHFKLSRILGVTYVFLALFSTLPVLNHLFGDTPHSGNVPPAHLFAICALLLASLAVSSLSVFSVSRFTLTAYKTHWLEVKKRGDAAQSVVSPVTQSTQPAQVLPEPNHEGLESAEPDLQSEFKEPGCDPAGP
jgi:hypothetical protein